MARPDQLRSRGSARRNGFALVAVLWVGVILALISSSVLGVSQSDRRLAHNLSRATEARLAAEGALWIAVHQIATRGPNVWRTDGTVYSWPFAGMEVRARVTDEQGRIDLNMASEPVLSALFTAAGMEAPEAERLARAVVTFRSPPMEAPVEGVDTAPLAFALTDALLLVPGITPTLHERIHDAVTVYTGMPQPQTGISSPLVLTALGISTAESDGQHFVSLPDAPEGLGPDVLTASPEVAPERTSGFSGLVRVEAEALSPDGTHSAIEAVIRLPRNGADEMQTRLWHQGNRRLFAPEG